MRTSYLSSILFCSILFLWKTSANARLIIILGTLCFNVTKISVCQLKVLQMCKLGRIRILRRCPHPITAAPGEGSLLEVLLPEAGVAFPQEGYALIFLSLTETISASKEKTSMCNKTLPFMYLLVVLKFSLANYDRSWCFELVVKTVASQGC